MLETGIGKRRHAGAVLACLCLLLSVSSPADPPADPASTEPEALAPGWKALAFDPPEAGTYRLPPIGNAGDGSVIDSDGNETTLHGLLADRIVVMSFIYSSCSDVNGCPLATFVLSRLKSKLMDSPAGAEGVRFISLSFDPTRDTPEVMRSYGRRFSKQEFDWRFLTTQSERDLAPILESYGQLVVPDPVEDGEGGDISHILRVYLVDPERRIRNIYSVAYLHPDTLFNDIRTLQQEVLAGTPDGPSLQGPGDRKEGYERGDYTTRSQSLERRKGRSVDLMAYVQDPPLGLPPIPEPAGNAITAKKVELGRLLFFDRRLSHNDTISCAMCHIPEQGFTSNEIATAVGIEGRTVRRNAPTIYNVAYLERLFHDGREATLEQQIWGPLLAANEMGNPSVGQVIEQVKAIPGYQERFEAAFEGRPPSMETLGMALASYQRLLISSASHFDRWYYGSDEAALTKEQVAGFELFNGSAGCSGCHLINEAFALFTDNQMHNTGIGYRRSMLKAPDELKVHIAPGVEVKMRGDVVADASEPPPNDLGLYEITGNPADRWKYRTPSLRNVALTAPYMHDGSIATLEKVIAFYDEGGVENEVLDPRIRPLGLDQEQKAQLVAFLRALTGENVDQLVADAFAVPVGNTNSGQ